MAKSTRPRKLTKRKFVKGDSKLAQALIRGDLADAPQMPVKKEKHPREICCDNGALALGQPSSDDEDIVDELRGQLNSIDWKDVKARYGQIAPMMTAQFEFLQKLLANLSLIMKVEDRLSIFDKEMLGFLGERNPYERVELFSKYEMYLAYYNLYHMMKHDFKVSKVFNMKYGELCPPTYADIYIDHDKCVAALVDGYVSLRYKDRKLVIGIKPGGEGTCNLDVHVHHDDTFFLREFVADFKKSMDSNNFYRGKKLEVHSGGFFDITKPSNKTWDDIVIDPLIRTEIEDNVINLIGNADMYRKNGIPLSRGIILEGSYGLGKTLLCQVLCNSVDCTVFQVSPKALGNSEIISYIYDVAVKFAPSIVMLEDLDLFSKDRTMDAGYKDAIMGELMNQLNGIDEKHGVITIATTNRIEVIEKALKDRPGRFDRVLHFHAPDREQRMEILSRIISRHRHEDIDFGKWAERMDGFSGSHLNDFVTTSVIQAIKGKSFHDKRRKLALLKDEHLEEAFEKIHKITVNRRMGLRADR